VDAVEEEKEEEHDGEDEEEVRDVHKMTLVFFHVKIGQTF
jgi:hypothetical protein